MPTSKYWNQCPPFPSDVPIADIPTVSLRGLEEEEDAAATQLWDACRHHGFFQLDLHSSAQGTPLLEAAERMYDLTLDTFALDKAVLDEYAYQPQKSLHGYKAAGRLPTDDGRVDATEMYTVGQDDIMGLTHRAHPAPVEARRDDCRDFIQRCHRITQVIQAHLDHLLGLQPGTLATLTPLDKESQTAIRLLLVRPSASTDESRHVTLPGHTDIGTITLLFPVAGGLQILPAGCENQDAHWRYVRPEQGCVLVNLGDTLVEWTGGLLRSCLHRVVTAPGRQREVTRLNLGYLVRPARDATMRRLRGPKSIIPVAAEGEDDTRSSDEWAAWKAQLVVTGVLHPQSSGGIPVAT